jgi:uncharacterized hydrophobic protein (TIGR00271 family)
VLHLRVYGTTGTIDDVTQRLVALPGVRHVVQSGDGARCEALVTADLGSDAADPTLDALRDSGVADDDIELLRLESIGPRNARRPLAGVVWADMLNQAGTNARPLGRFLVFMAMAGVIAGFGVIYSNGILIVGAMAISPDTLPITATCTGLILRRWRLAFRAFVTLTIGLGFACLVAAGMSAMLNAFDALPDDFSLDSNVLQGLDKVNVSTPLVALAAGVVGILALETRASSSVGVAISVTTIPASAYLGVAAGVGEASQAAGALAVLGINVACLILSGTGTLSAQRRLNRPGAAPRSARGRTDRAVT